MGSTPGTEEYERFVSISDRLESAYLADDRWVDSPFAWIKKLPSRQVGKAAEQLVAAWLESHGLDVSSSPDSDADRVVEGTRLEIKSSTLWRAGSYKFQQIRDQSYEVLICLGLSPEEVHAWTFPKAVLMRLWREGEIPSQHGGASGTDTAWLQIDPTPPPTPEWVNEWGGSLEAAYEQLLNLIR